MKAAVKNKSVIRERELRPKAAVQRRIASLRPEKRGLAVKSILVPIDFSETSKAALRYAVTLAQDYGADISLIHVVEPEAYNLLSEIEMASGKLTFAESATARLTKLAREEVPSSMTVNSKVKIGVPYDEIASAAKILNADMIVIATHGYTGFRHAILGSTAERVVQHAPCPVLVVRNAETQNTKGSL
jgi:universal stress protein A